MIRNKLLFVVNMYTKLYDKNEEKAVILKC